MNKPLLILFLIFGSFAFGQNLVPNPSFEDTVYCPNGTNDPNAIATWFNPTMASPDYYNACASNGGGVPVNDWGYQEAQDGVAYIGIGTYGAHPTVTNYREYYEVELLESLINGQKYNWCMFVSRLDSTNLASNNIGISLTTNSINNMLSEEMLVAPVAWSSDMVVTDDINWTKLSGHFTAQGGERFLTIGNFYSEANTSYTQVLTNSSNGDLAYYYIDNVYLGMEPCTEVILEIPNVFTPNMDGINEILTFKEVKGLDNYSVSIFNRWGNLIYFGENQFGWNGTYYDEPVSEGIYFYRIDYNKNESKTGFVQVVR